MVDSTKFSGTIQNIQQVSNKTTSQSKGQTEKTSAPADLDTVELSQDAQVLTTLSQTRDFIAQSNVTLGLDASALEE